LRYFLRCRWSAKWCLAAKYALARSLVPNPYCEGAADRVLRSNFGAGQSTHSLRTVRVPQEWTYVLSNRRGPLHRGCPARGNARSGRHLGGRGRAGLTGLTLLEFNCVNPNLFHILFWHGGVVLLRRGVSQQCLEAVRATARTLNFAIEAEEPVRNRRRPRALGRNAISWACAAAPPERADGRDLGTLKLIRAGHPAEGSIYGRRKPDSGKIPCQPSGRAYKHFEVGLLSEGDLPYDPYAAPIHRYGLV
jgi:hypothetical protein